MSLRQARPAPWLVLLLLTACRGVEAVEDAPTWPTPSRGMVVSEHPLATEVGAGILDQGGNAADAAVATALALAVVYPQAGNLGGGGFALWVPHEGRPLALDFRETAPASASPDLYRGPDGEIDPERSRSGALAIGVPGSPAGLWELYRRCGSGRLSFRQLVRPAIELARGGFTVDGHMERALRSQTVRARMERSPAARELFYPDGIPLSRGRRLVQPELADTLARLARGGPREFYSGPSAGLLVVEVQRLARSAGLQQPWITAEDLEAYQPVWREPLVGWFRGHQILTMPPPSSGGVVLLQTLAVLEGLPLEAERQRALADLGPDGALGRGYGPALGIDDRILHWWIETLRAAFAARAEFLGDSDFVAVPLDRLLSSEWVARCRVSIGESAHPELSAELPPPAPEGSQTTHLSVIDQDGNAVSLTTTLNSSFGAGVVVRGAGFLLNNEMDDFALQGAVPNQFGLIGGEANRIAPGKRPLSSMTPTVVRDGGHAVTLVLGSPGGPRIITAVVGVLLRVLVFDQDLESAVAAPRLHQQWSPPYTEFEPGWDESLLEVLRRRRGHDARVVDRTWASVQAIRIPLGGRPVGVSDSRRGGSAQAQRKLRKP